MMPSRILLQTLFMGVVATVVVVDAAPAVLPKQATDNTPWEDLRSVLNDPSTLSPTISSPTEWQEQCVQIFENIAKFPGVDGSFPVVSNYVTMNQPSGLCLDHVSCAYEYCAWPPEMEAFPNFPLTASPFVIQGNNLDESDLESDNLLLPAMVLQPTTAGDIVKAVEFCKVHQVGITVKVAGHSYFGASTGKNTLLIKMNPSYPKYGIGGSLVECDSVGTTGDGIITNVTEIGVDTTAGGDGGTSTSNTTPPPSADEMACAVATSRNKNAVMRVGGGEIFDEAYRAVSIEWNGNNINKYHLVGGGAGTVSSAGGWMASGGLSGTTGMRMFGVGIDNVVALEMVLPTGQHVRLAPTSWSTNNETMMSKSYPKTLNVTGYCNKNSDATDETLWEWGDCESPVDFNELWFAARGGGGGTYGIVTSLHYQLHDYPGLLRYVAQDPSVFPENTAEIMTEEALYYLQTRHVEFLLRFLYLPETLGVAEEDSRACNSAQTAHLSPYLGGVFFCYNNSGPVLVNTWQAALADETLLSDFRANGIPDAVIDVLPNLYVVAGEVDSYAAAVIGQGEGNAQIPEGRMPDSPPGSLVPVLGNYPSLADAGHTHIPLAAVVADPMGMSQLLALDPSTIYAMGGMVPFADDGLNSLSSTRRNAAFLMAMRNPGVRDFVFSIAFGGLNPSSDDFPGSSCHNHALTFEMGPLKANWSKACPIDWPQEERQELCISQNEASWGTANLARLEAFKSQIDPDNLFICASGVGYSNPVTGDETQVPVPPTDGSGSFNIHSITLPTLIAFIGTMSVAML